MVLSGEAMLQRLTSNSVFYAEAAAAASDGERDENVYLIASRGDEDEEVAAVGINNAVLASVSPLCRQLLVQHQDRVEPQDDRFCYISTELKLKDLETFVKFASTGFISAADASEHVPAADDMRNGNDRKIPLINDHLIEVFMSLGVDLKPINWKLELVPKAATQGQFQPAVHKVKRPKRPVFIKTEPDVPSSSSTARLKAEEQQQKQQQLDFHDYYPDESLYFDEESEPLQPKRKKRKRKAEKTKKVNSKQRQETYEDFWNDNDDVTNEESDVQVKDESGEVPDVEDEPVSKQPRKKRLTKRGNEVAGLKCETSTGDFSGLQPWCSEEKLAELKEELFSFPQDESLRDPTLKHQCGLCVKGFNKKFKLDQHKRRHFAKSRDDLYFCLVCPQYLAFPTQNQLFIHNKECHKKPPKAPGPSNGVQDASLLHSWCSKEKLEEIKAELFDFPQDESLRDLSLRHQCDRCVKGFKVKYQFDQHKKRHDAKSRDDMYFCLVCPDYVAFPSQNQLFIHMKSDLHNTQEKRTCPYCPKVFARSPTLLQLHILNEHTQHKGPDLTTCYSCGKIFNTRKQNCTHRQQMGNFHDGKCRICPNFETVLWSENLKHFNEVHGGQIQYKCGYCPKYFSTPHQVRVHVSNECDGEKNQHYERMNNTTTCDECGETVKKIGLKQHKEARHGTDNVSCDKCGRTFKHKNTLYKHTCVSTKYQCDQCEFMGNKSHLQYHKIAKHTPEHLRPYQCHICPKGFALKKHMEMHINVHMGIKPYECKYCGMKFASDGNMNGHIRQTHKGIKRNSSKSQHS